MKLTNLEFKNAVATRSPTNHVFVADVSGSMYSELPKIRNHLKNNLATLVKKDDTVSILYFSSRGQFGSVFTGQKISDINDLTEINNAIDRYLRPTGCTGFVEPLNMASDVAMQLSTENGNMNSLIFMTDGYDNCWSTNEILKACATLPLSFNEITFLEYGWYCNRPLLEKMAEATNALHKFTESFEQYEPAFEEAIQSMNSKKIEITVPESEAVLYIDGDNIHVVNVSGGIARIPEHISSAVGIGATAVEDVEHIDDEDSLFTTLYYAIHTMNSDLAWAIMKKLGDIRLIKLYDNCFTKQDYSNAKLEIEKAVIDKSMRFVDGVDYNMVPDENAYTILDLLGELVEIPDLKLDLNMFTYSRTGRKTKQKADDGVSKLSDAIASAETTEQRKAIAMQLVGYEEWTPEFVQTDTIAYMNNIVMNGNRPNISINTSVNGTVSVPKEIQKKYKLPSVINTHRYRNYTIVKDGIVNVAELPVVYNAENYNTLFNLLVAHDIKFYDCKGTIIIDITSLPLVNRSMTRGIDGIGFVKDNIQLQSMKALQKVMKFYRDELVGKVNAVGLATQYGDDAAAYLSEKGIRDYGFSPLTEREESTDVYMSKELNVKIKGLSSLPAVNAVKKKIEGNKTLNAGDFLMKRALDSYELNKGNFADNESLLEWIASETKAVITRVRKLNTKIAKTAYGVVVGHGWFDGIDFENPSLTVNMFDRDFDVTIELEEKEIKV